MADVFYLPPVPRQTRHHPSCGELPMQASMPLNASTDRAADADVQFLSAIHISYARFLFHC